MSYLTMVIKAGIPRRKHYVDTYAIQPNPSFEYSLHSYIPRFTGILTETCNITSVYRNAFIICLSYISLCLLIIKTVLILIHFFNF
jgi:hypothetical protein